MRVITRALVWVLVLAGSTGPTSAKALDPEAVPPEPPGFWTGPVNDPVPATIHGGKVIHTRGLDALLKKQGPAPVVLDVSNAPRRPENLPASTAWLPLPHPAIPGALWIPGAGLGEAPRNVEAFLRESLAKATAGDFDRTVVVYCHQRCWLSWNGAKRAIGYGYRHVYWYPDGIEGWRKAKLPTVVAEPQFAP